MGMNKANGFNSGFNYVNFADGLSSFKFSTQVCELAGVMFGERIMNFLKYSYYIDEVNRLFCKISWGKNKSSTDP